MAQVQLLKAAELTEMENLMADLYEYSEVPESASIDDNHNRLIVMYNGQKTQRR